MRKLSFSPSYFRFTRFMLPRITCCQLLPVIFFLGDRVMRGVLINNLNHMKSISYGTLNIYKMLIMNEEAQSTIMHSPMTGHLILGLIHPRKWASPSHKKSTKPTGSTWHLQGPPASRRRCHEVGPTLIPLPSHDLSALGPTRQKPLTCHPVPHLATEQSGHALAGGVR